MSREAPMEEALPVGATPVEAEPDLKERLARAIDSLSKKYRMVFVIHDPRALDLFEELLTKC